MGAQVASGVILALLCLPGATLADELVFKNGDRLQGTVVQAAAGRLTFDSAMVGKVTASVEELESFTTDEEIELHLADGTVVNDRIVRDQSGMVQFADRGD